MLKASLKKVAWLLFMIFLVDLTALFTTYYALRLEPEIVYVDGEIGLKRFIEDNPNTKFWLDTFGLELGLALGTLRMLAFFGAILFFFIVTLPYAFKEKECKLLELGSCAFFSFIMLMDGVLNVMSLENAGIPFMLLTCATVALWFLLAYKYWRLKM